MAACGVLAVGWVISVGAFALGGFVVGQYAERSGLYSALPALGITGPSRGGTPSDLVAAFGPFWQAWDVVHSQYVDQPIDNRALMRGAIRGMLAALDDPYTAYLDPQQEEIANTGLEGEFEGIGATVETDEATGYTRVVAPIAGSPAETAGVRTGDLIITIDGEDIVGQDITTVVSKVRGPAGSQVTLELRREGETDLLRVTITRGVITIESVESRMLEGQIGYVRINSFGDDTARDFREQLQTLIDQSPTGLIVDLRGNPGGLLTTAIDVVSELVPDGVVMREQFGDGSQREYEAHPGGLATTLPLVVLIDEGSASASEIVAGAVQDRRRGQLVGATSFGKGSVQTVVDLAGDGVVRVTIARWLTPNGAWIHERGITPNVIVERSAEDIEAGRDPQLDAAVRMLTP
jgi:carboxyl-terminal processing protease